MAGHSKWSNIKHKKGKADAKRGTLFTKIGREISMAVKQGGPDPDINSRLRDAIAKAKAANMPNDNINRSIKRASGATDTDNFEEFTYEGYGANGVAVIVDILTDNRNRTAGDVRHLFDKYGGNLGTTGCVSYLFEEKGTLILSKEEYTDADQVMMDALEAGAEDILDEEEVYEVTLSPADYESGKNQLEGLGYQFLDASRGLVPNTWVSVADPDTRANLNKMLDLLDDLEDVKEVYHNFEEFGED